MCTKNGRSTEEKGVKGLCYILPTSLNFLIHYLHFRTFYLKAKENKVEEIKKNG